MGSPLHFSEANFVLGPPAEFEDEVIPLPVRRDPEGKLVSCWSVTAEEIAEICRTGKVWLSVWSGLTQPPVYVTGHRHEVLGAET